MSRRQPRLAILGAGPIGLEAGLYAASLSLPFRIYERGQVAENLRHWGHVRLFTPFGHNSTPLGRALLRREAPRHSLPADGEMLTGRELLTAYLEPLADCPTLQDHIEIGTTVLAIGRQGLLKEELPGDRRRADQPFRLLLRDESGQERVEEADVVLDCTGSYGNGRSLGDGGIPVPGESQARPYIACGVEDILGERREYYADSTTLVVGAGYSAATTVSLLAQLAEQHPATWIIWLARRPGSQPIRRHMGDPFRERDLLASRANTLATRGEGNVEFFSQSLIEAIEFSDPKDGFTVHARVGTAQKTWQVDRLIANVGFDPDNRLYRELQVHECFSTLAPLRSDDLPGFEPNFFVLGYKSGGRSSSFLLRDGFAQIRETFAILSGKKDLDLYKQPR